MKFIKRLYVFFFMFLFSVAVIFGETPECVKSFMQLEYMKNADFSLIVKDIDSGKIVYDYNIEKSIIPASILKVVTTATALESLGPNYYFETFLQHDGVIDDCILYGNIYIKGDGDPTLGSEYFKSKFLDDFVDAIKKLGIKEIKGSIIADESVFDKQGINPKWQVEDIGLSYAAGSYGINVFDNRYKLRIESGVIGSKPVIKEIWPEIKINFINNLIVSDRPTNVSILGIPFSNERYINGKLPPNSSFVFCGDIPDPPLYLANLLTKKIKDVGIIIEGNPRCLDTLSNDLEKIRYNIVNVRSPILIEIVKIINHQSNNLFADAILKKMGSLYVKSDDPLSSFEKGVKFLKKYWYEKGIDTSFLLYDGSGLTSSNRVTAVFISDILEFMAKSPMSDIFISSFPIAGVEGTVKNLLSKSYLQGKALLKSGSMTGIKCYAGYIKKEEKKYVIGIFANNYRCSNCEINRAIEDILLNLFSFLKNN